MSHQLICVLLTTSLVTCAFSEKAAPLEFVKKQSIDDKQLTNIVRVKNSSNPNINDSDVYDKSLDKQSRTVNHRLQLDSRDNCCGSRYDSNIPPRPDSYHNKIPTNGDRYPSKYGERLPTDRYGWQTQGQPPGWSGNIGRPGSGNYFGNTLYQGNQAGDRFGSRPNYGSESTRKPGGYESTISGGYSYGGYGFGRPTGHGGSSGSGSYGISGTLANGDEFGGAEPNYPEENAPAPPNIQTQKAVALKALAGVALIGAAAALAANPVLLPIGIVSGRKKRSSLSVKDEDFYMDYILKALKANSTKVHDNEGKKKMSISPTCIARLTCELQKRYWSDPKKKDNILRERKELERRFTNLISNNIPNAEAVDARIKKLIKAATVVASNGWHCNTFTCTLIKTSEAKDRLVFKV